jgi:hypothetical protein
VCVRAAEIEVYRVDGAGHVVLSERDCHLNV